jgi:hypothetical protein
MSNPIEEYLSTYTQTNYIFDPLSLVTIRGNQITIKTSRHHYVFKKTTIPLSIQMDVRSRNFSRTIRTYLCQREYSQNYISETQISSDFDVSVVIQSSHNSVICARTKLVQMMYLDEKPLLLLRKTREEHMRLMAFIDKIVSTIIIIVMCVVFISLPLLSLK